MTSRRRGRRRVHLLRPIGAALAVGLCAVLLGASPAGAGKIPLPPLPSPTLPPQVKPVLGLVAPVVSPECGNLALSAALIIPSLAGDIPGGLPFAPAPLFAPILAICGSVPVPGEELTCQADATIAALAAQGITDVLGSEGGLLGKVLDLALFGQVTEEVQVLEDVAPSQLQGIDLSSLVANALKCTKVAGVAPILGTAPPSYGSVPGAVTTPSDATFPVQSPSTDTGGGLGLTGGGLSISPGGGTTTTPPTVAPSGRGRSTVALPGRTGLAASELISPSSTVAQGGAIVGFLLLASGALAVYLRNRRAVQSAGAASDDAA